ncbi:hypothetical protein [Luteimicrobium subarcticum]|uniref:Uncharacterized protein n=1 Tax=Luteimicrobium subarcticum TaxID=620910 RepID=A0A2M8W6Y8_9MICO|nr:hypothetical protein [Luteimicrobium subarcticum]PJI86693.1 hypothetical protein CLV34_2613 [Luteimicrobium subarcticum]
MSDLQIDSDTLSAVRATLDKALTLGATGGVCCVQDGVDIGMYPPTALGSDVVSPALVKANMALRDAIEVTRTALTNAGTSTSTVEDGVDQADDEIWQGIEWPS